MTTKKADCRASFCGFGIHLIPTTGAGNDEGKILTFYGYK
jgi:hypothetical protein